MIGTGFLGVKVGLAARGLNTTVTMRGVGLLGEAECDGLSEGLTLMEIEADDEVDGEREGDSDVLGEREGEGELDGETDNDSLAEGLWLADGESDRDALELGLTLALGLTDLLSLADGD